MLKRGTPVIINDIDAPEGRMIAVIIRYDKTHGYWKARYLCDRIQTYCHSSGSLGMPTPIADFGMKLEWLDDKTFRAVPTDEPSVAKYRDGVPRDWQEPHTKHLTTKRMAKRVMEKAGTL
jgi:hypothetical protein